MLEDIQRLILKLNEIQSYEEFSLQRAGIVEELSSIQSEYTRMKFKYERSNKEKNILSSLLTRTSSDLKKVSENLKIRAEELSTMLATIPAYVYFKDKNLNYMLVNQSFAEFVGVSEVDIKGKKLTDVFRNYNDLSYLQKEKEVIDLGVGIYDIEEEVEHEGRQRWVNTNLAPIRNTFGEIVGLIGISWDITERKHYESELKDAKELAEAGTMAKNEFIASISHEFRTPMNGILGLAEILKNTRLDEAQEEHLKGIVSSAENLLVLVNDLLDFSAIEAGKMELDFHPFMLSRLLDEVFIMLNIKAREKSLDFSIIINEDVPNHIVGDSQRLRQILLNLATNAIKFTEKGKVVIHVHIQSQSAEHVLIRFQVTDTGIGIPPEALNSLFKVFSRIRQKQHKLISGTGLGLSICKKLTDLLGGQIGVESVPGKGTDFWFTLPFDLSAPKIQNPYKTVDTGELIQSGKKVLVAEDNKINQKIVSFQLRRLGFEVELADDGQVALDKFVKSDFDLVILDIQMPELDGYQVAKAIRFREKKTSKHVPIIALTANAMKGDRELYLEAGMDGYVSKPFTPEALKDAIILAEKVTAQFRKD